jgi:hypothetical protein
VLHENKNDQPKRFVSAAREASIREKKPTIDQTPGFPPPEFNCAVVSSKPKQHEHRMSSWRGGGGGMGGAAASLQQQQQQQQQPIENGPRAKCDQVVFEAIAKAAEIVVGSRCHIGGGGPPPDSYGQSNNNNNHQYPNNGGGIGGGGRNAAINSNNNNNGSRFNLMVPEVQGVRYVLGCYRGQPTVHPCGRSVGRWMISHATLTSLFLPWTKNASFLL